MYPVHKSSSTVCISVLLYNEFKMYIKNILLLIEDILHVSGFGIQELRTDFYIFFVKSS
jgi:hypothetical protein